MRVLVFLSLMSLTAAAAKFEDQEGWNLWKTQHAKSYSEEREELERHFVWLSNMKYIEHHNANADIFGFTLAMNQFGDMVMAIRICLVLSSYTKNIREGAWEVALF